MGKALKVGIAILATIVLLCAGGLIYFYSHGTQTVSGRFLRAKNGITMIISEKSGTIQLTGSEVNFDKYSDGDKLIVRCDEILETYPAMTKAYICFRTEKGDISDIPAKELDSLRELGWTD